MMSFPHTLVAILIWITFLSQGARSESPPPQPWELPALYAVRDVAADDVLNVRAAPSARAEILDTLAPDATGIEITAVSPDGRWGRIPLSETNGWISMRYVERLPGQDSSTLSLPLVCWGGEPFWNLAIDLGVADFSSPDMESLAFTTEWITGGPWRYALRMKALAETSQATAVIRREECGVMSDRLAGLTVDLIIETGTGGAAPLLLSGCCNLVAR